MILVLKVRVKFSDVRVVIGKSVVDFEFLSELLDHVVLKDGGLENFLQGKQEACGFMFAHVDIPKFARSYTLAKLELPHAELTCEYGLFVCSWLGIFLE